MDFINMIQARRSVYNLNKNIPIFDDKIVEIVRDCVKYVPDAFGMQSQRVVVVLGHKNDDLWNAIYDKMVTASNGRFSRDRADSFIDGYGTILYFYDTAIVTETQRQYPLYSDKFHDWIMQSNGMLQFAIWTAFATVGIGANLQHYNPIIDKTVQNMFDLPESWVLVAQMPFGGISLPPSSKHNEDVSWRIKVEK